eukprot:2345469-Pyramimonas_sp.AAC.1
MPSIPSFGLSCRADDTIKKRGGQFVHGCPYLPGDNRTQSGLRVDSEVLIMVSLKNLVRDNIPIWRSANDIVMTAGRNCMICLTRIVQLIGPAILDSFIVWERYGEILYICGTAISRFRA